MIGLPDVQHPRAWNPVGLGRLTRHTWVPAPSPRRRPLEERSLGSRSAVDDVHATSRLVDVGELPGTRRPRHPADEPFALQRCPGPIASAHNASVAGSASHLRLRAGDLLPASAWRRTPAQTRASRYAPRAGTAVVATRYNSRGEHAHGCGIGRAARRAALSRPVDSEIPRG